MSRHSAGDRLRRLLSLLPWLADHPGTTIGEICDRFGFTRDQLLADLDVVWMVGIPPYTPDQLIELQFDEDRVSILLGSYFQRPLRLTPDQALALVTAGQSLLAEPGADPEGPLARGLAKLARALQLDPDAAVAVHLGAAGSEILEHLRAAIRSGRRVRLDYYSFGRDERSEREVDPHRLWAEGGSWYLGAHCHRAEGTRVFRLDRVVGVEVLDTATSTVPDPGEPAVFTPTSEGATATLRLDPEAAWVVDYYPNEGVQETDDGSLRVVLPVASVRWLEQLLVRLGPLAAVEALEGGLPADPGPGAARRVLARYHR